MLSSSRIRSKLAVVGALLALVALPLGLVGAGAANAAVATSAQYTSSTVSSVARNSVGPLFLNGVSNGHSCTAGVVDSPAGNVIVTAAHCLSGSGVGTLFVPGHVNGYAPYGAWVVKAAYVARGWITNQYPQEDYAFLVVAPQHSSQGSVENAVGASTLGTTASSGTTVAVSGYPGSSDTPVSCTARTYNTSGYATFNCGGFADGTSGSPWLVSSSSGKSTIVGAIGGLHQGGCQVNVSYSSGFNSTTKLVYNLAVSGATPRVLPTAGSSGC